jgi:cadmium resistance protein CadD (predicted permease)
MSGLAANVASASALFVGTNLDDLVVLAVLGVSSRVDGKPRTWEIWAGQYAGVTVLVGASWLAALGLTLLPESHAWLLGLVPTGLGLQKLAAAVRARRSRAPSSVAVVRGFPGVMAVTLANGGDNIAAYTPVFRTSSTGAIAVTIGVFALGVALLCLAGSWLVSHDKIRKAVQRWGHWIVSIVFIVIGLSILNEAPRPLLRTGLLGATVHESVVRQVAKE